MLLIGEYFSLSLCRDVRITHSELRQNLIVHRDKWCLSLSYP